MLVDSAYTPDCMSGMAASMQCSESNMQHHLAELSDFALCKLLAAKRNMIPVCSEAKVIGCVHEAIPVHHLYTSVVTAAFPHMFAALHQRHCCAQYGTAACMQMRLMQI